MSIDSRFYRYFLYNITRLRYLIASTLFLVFASPAFSQSPPQILWQKCIGGGTDDNARKIINTADGGSVIVGGTMSNDGDVSGNHGLVDYLVVKLAANGAIEWQRALGGNVFDLACGIQQTADGKYIVAGYSGSSDGDVAGFLGGMDCWIVRLDTNGDILWQKSFGGSGYENAYAIEQTNDNGFIIAGNSGSVGGDVSNNNGIVDFWVIKLDANGVLQWERSYGGSGIEGAGCIKQTTDGGYIVAGYTNSNDKDVSGNHGKDDYWVLRLTSNGNIMWQKCYGGSNNDYANDVLQSSDGGFLIAGHSNSNDGDITGNHGDYDYWIVKVDANGNMQWQKSYGGSQGDLATSIRRTSNNTYVIGGMSSSVNGDVTGNHGMADVWVIETSASGAIQWQNCYGGSGMDYEATVIVDGDGVIMIGGATTSNDGDVSGNHSQGHDLWVAKLKPPPCTPTISISSSTTNICYNPTIIISALATNEGRNPVYRWKKNGTVVASTNTAEFRPTLLNKNDVITCELTSNATCAFEQPVVISNSITMRADEIVPEVTVTASTTTICTGTNVTFTAFNKSGNPKEVYQWTVDGVEAAGDTTVFSSSTLKNGAVVICRMTVPHCKEGTTKDFSDPITMVVNEFLQPAVTITTANTTICKGSNTVFTATAQRAGANPVYKWMINGNVANSNGSTFSTNVLNDGDIVTGSVEVDRTAPCIGVNSAVSNQLEMKLIEGLVPTVSISAPDMNVCEGTSLTFSATPVNAGNASSYRWMVNGTDVGVSSINYTSSALVSGDRVNCVLIPQNSTCGNNPVNSNIITLALKPLPIIRLTPADTIVAAGTELKLVATVTGDVSSFTWTPANKLANASTLTRVTKPLNETTTFRLQVTSTGNCVAAKQTAISVFTKLYMPRSFTPNADGKNDVFRIPPSTRLTLNDFTVYGRWGNILFRTKDLSKGWDGTYNGLNLETGTYIYSISGSTETEKIFIKGTVVLLR